MREEYTRAGQCNNCSDEISHRKSPKIRALDLRIVFAFLFREYFVAVQNRFQGDFAVAFARSVTDAMHGVFLATVVLVANLPARVVELQPGLQPASVQVYARFAAFVQTPDGPALGYP